jgi:hypothetical protein
LILDACNDTIRALPSKESNIDFSFQRESFPIYKHAVLTFEEDPDEGNVPIIIMCGDKRFIYEIRDKIGHGIVYNEEGRCYYTCVGLDDIVDYVIPFLDKARLARIIVGNGEYAQWRDRIVCMYKGEEI